MTRSALLATYPGKLTPTLGSDLAYVAGGNKIEFIFSAGNNVTSMMVLPASDQYTGC